MKNISLIILVLLLLIFKNTHATTIYDPRYDYFPWAQENGFMDISSVDTRVENDELIINAAFYNEITNYVPRGMFHMDLDQDASTGAFLGYKDINPDGWYDTVYPIGAEYVLDFSGYVQLGKARLYRTNGIINNCDIRQTILDGYWTDFGLYDLIKSSYSFQIAFPNMITNDDGNMDFTLIASAARYPKINPQDVAQSCTPIVPEPSTFILLASLTLGIYYKKRN